MRRPNTHQNLVGLLLFKSISLRRLLVLKKIFIPILHLLKTRMGFLKWVILLRVTLKNGVVEHEHRLFVGPKIRKDLMGRADNQSSQLTWVGFGFYPSQWFGLWIF